MLGRTCRIRASICRISTFSGLSSVSTPMKMATREFSRQTLSALYVGIFASRVPIARRRGVPRPAHYLPKPSIFSASRSGYRAGRFSANEEDCDATCSYRESQKAHSSIDAANYVLVLMHWGSFDHVVVKPALVQDSARGGAEAVGGRLILCVASAIAVPPRPSELITPSSTVEPKF
jgi:hypothetical protein